MKRYVTTDLDYPSRIEIVTAWNRVSEYADGRPYGRVSQSGHGVHIKSHRRREADTPTRAKPRRRCLDDPKRIDGDRAGDLYHKQVLFSSPYPWVRSVDRLVRKYESATTLTPTQYKVKYGDNP